MLEVFPPQSIVPETLVSDTGISYFLTIAFGIVFSIAPESTSIEMEIEMLAKVRVNGKTK